MKPFTQQSLTELFYIKDHEVQAQVPQHSEVLSNVKEYVHLSTGDLNGHTGDTSAPTQQRVLRNPAELC